MTKSTIPLAVIVAAAENGVIGNNNRLPWHLPEDLRYFKRVTMGKPIVMGRRTYESIGRPLPGRVNIVITRNTGFLAAGVEVVHSLEAALCVATREARKGDARELVVIGGTGIFALAIPRADRLYMTEVHARVEGDVLLPAIDWSMWSEIRREWHAAAAPDSYDYSFVVYDKCGN